MKTYTILQNLFGSLSQNTTTANLALGAQFINDQHRYLLQKYFDNERTVTTKTVGAMPLTLTTTPTVGATTATLATAWLYQTCSQLVTFADGESRPVRFILNSTSLSWDSGLNGKQYQLTAVVAAGGTSATLSTAWPNATQSLSSTFSDGTVKTVTYTLNSTAITWAGGLSNEVSAYVNTYSADVNIDTVGVQDYNIPANVSKIKNNTINVGQLKFQPTFVQSRQEWDMINTLPYTSDIPNYCFIYNGKLSIFPIPSTTGNILTFNYKTRIPDLTFTDYITGTIDTAGMVAGSTAVTGLATSWSTTAGYPLNIDVSAYNLYLRADPPKGDGIWYPILSFQSNTALTLALPVISAPNITNTTTYTIGQMPLLSEDFHDMLVQAALVKYFSTIVPNAPKAAEWKEIYNNNLELLKDYAGTKSVNVDLEAEPQQINPNLFIYGN